MRDGTDRVQGQYLNDKYLINGVIGSGGRALILLAVDTEDGSRCAIKLPRTATPTLCREIRHEAKILRQLGGCHTPRFYAAGDTMSGDYFVAMEYIEARSLEDWIAQGTFSEADALEITESLATVVRALHSLGYLHRDLKPLNVLVPQHDGRPQTDRTVLIDYGLARAFEAGESAGAVHTPFGEFAGSAYYMAPEQLAGRRLTTATDIYAIGATLFAMLFGHPPGIDTLERVVAPIPKFPRMFVGPMVARRLTEEVSIPHRDDISDSTRDFLTRSLRRDPRERIDNAADVLEWLRIRRV
jgi:serine/threonine protein kinase